jgi:hypothetical protein
MWHLGQGASERACALDRRSLPPAPFIRLTAVSAAWWAGVCRAGEEQDFDRQLRPRPRAATGPGGQMCPTVGRYGRLASRPSRRRPAALSGKARPYRTPRTSSTSTSGDDCKGPPCGDHPTGEYSASFRLRASDAHPHTPGRSSQPALIRLGGSGEGWPGGPSRRDQPMGSRSSPGSRWFGQGGLTRPVFQSS